MMVRSLIAAVFLLCVSVQPAASVVIKGGGAGDQCPVAVFSSTTETYTEPSSTSTVVAQAWTELYDPTGSWSVSGTVTGGIEYDGDTSAFDDWLVRVVGTYYCYDAAGGGTAGTTCSSDGEWYQVTVRNNDAASCALSGNGGVQANSTKNIAGMGPAYDGTGTALATTQPDWAYLPFVYEHLMVGWGNGNDVTTADSCLALAVGESAANLGDFALNNVVLTITPQSANCHN